MKRIKFSANAIDRALSVIAPRAALRRMHSRGVFNALAGGYHGGSKSRRAGADHSAKDYGPESALHFDLPTLRARSRHLYRNSPIPRGAVNEKVSVVVGPGHIVSPNIDRDMLGMSQDQADEWQGRMASIWREHARSEAISANYCLNFAELEALALRTVLLSGDALHFDRFKPRKGAAMATCVQLVEGDRLVNPHGKMDDDKVSGGVERDKDGQPKRYYVLDEHPGELRGKGTRKGEWYKAFAPDGRRRVRLLMFASRPGDMRGAPFLSPVIEALKQLDRYGEAELFAAVVNSCFAVTTKTEDGTGLDAIVDEAASGSGANERKEINIVEPGTITDLAQDEEIESFTPGRPSASFEPFFKAIVSQIAVALDTSEEVLMRTFKASYSASRGAIEVAYRFAQGYDAWLVSKFCQPVYESVVAEAIGRGLIDAPGFFEDPMIRGAYLGATWTGPARISLNPKAESDADRADLEMGVTDEFRLSAKRGQVYENVVANRARAQRLRDSAGLSGPATAPPANNQQPDDPNDDPADDDEEKQ